MARGFKVADAYIEVHLDDDTAKRDLAGLPQRISTDTDRSGNAIGRRMGQSVDKALTPEIDRSAKKNGDKLAQGMHLAIVRNSPLIAAGVGAALSAGAPAVIAGATTLFAGIGIAAAVQSAGVQKHWVDAWTGIIDGTVEDAKVLQMTVADMADQVAKGFSTLRPALRLIFADLAPILQSFTGSLIKMAQNAMPGLVAAVHAAGPVFQGLGSLVEDIGTGLSDFFQIISEHSQAAGTAFAAIGQIVGTLLPILGDLLGQGAELASVVLPPLAAILGVVADALHAIAPVLPMVAAGFGAFKLVSALSGPLKSFSQTLADMSYKNIPGLSSAAGKASSAVSGLGRALPAIGTALGLVGSVIVQSQQQIQEWAQALLDGGNAAEQAKAQMSGIEDFFDGGVTGISSATMGWTNWANALGVGSNASETAKQKAQDLYNAMSPLQQAQQDATAAQNNLSVAVDKYGASSPQAAAAAAAYKAAQAEVAAQSAATELAIEGVTEAMLNQANQALANASSSFAYDQATQQVADAQAHLAEVQKDSKSTSSDLNNATNSLNQALLAQVQAAGRLASDALPASTSETDKATAANGAMLAQLYQLRTEMGSAFPAALQQAIVGLQNSGATANAYSAQAYNALAATNNFIGGLFNLGQQHPQPTVSLNNQASGPLAGIQGQLNGLYSKTITITTVHRDTYIRAGTGINSVTGMATGGPVTKAASGRVVGPGTGSSDSIPAIGPGGSPWALSNGEWVINASAVKALETTFGRTAMPAINSGRLPTAVRGSDGAAAPVINVYVNGVAFADSVEFPQRLTETIRKELIKADRRTR